MNFVDKFNTDPWFAFSNLAVFGTLGYLFIDRVLAKDCNQSTQQSNIIPDYHTQSRTTIKKQKRQPIHKIVFSGGPCAGKTTACEQIKKVFEPRGYKVMIVPEAAKILVESGAMILMNRLTAEERIQFQTMVIRMVIHFEDYFVRLAEMSNQPAIIVCDRGTMDVQAYMSKDEFECMLDNQGWTSNYLRDKRYDEVIYMVTAADGAEEFYSLANNIARHESAQEAKALDGRTLQAWSGHSHLTILKNNKGETFEDKINNVIRTVQKVIGQKQVSRRTERYLIKQVQFPAQQQYFLTTVHDTFLVNQNPKQYIADRIQKVNDHGVTHYYRILVRNLGTITNHVTNQVRKLLTPLEYIYLLTSKKDQKYETVQSIRICFVHHKQFFVLTKVLLPTGKIQILQTVIISKPGQDVDVAIPSYIEIQKDISKSHEYDLIQLAKHKK